MNGRHRSDSYSVGLRVGQVLARSEILEYLWPGQGCQQPVGNGSNWLIYAGFSIDGEALHAAAALTSVIL